MGRPTSEAARDTRREILSAALDLFAEHGFHGASMRALAASVGVRESALYHYFSSKTALAEAVLADFAGNQVSEVEADLRPFVEQASLEELLAFFAQRALALMTSPGYRKILRIVMLSGSELGEEGETMWRRLMEEPRRALGRILLLMKKAGKIRDDVDLEIFQTHMMTPLLVASGTLFGPGRGPVTMPLARFVRQHVAFMVQALAPPRPAPAAQSRR